MCGVAGFIAGSSLEGGVDLMAMLKLLAHRGVDATGVAYYERREHVKLRVALRSPGAQGALEEMVAHHATILDSRCYHGRGVFTFCEFTLDLPEDAVGALYREIDGHPDLCVHSFGSRLTIIKDQGSAEELQRHHSIHPGFCSHGIGHVRLATESVEDVNLAHPFTSPLMPGLSMVHNGSFTNYFKVRRWLENKGVSFKTTNDSEMAANFLAYQMGVNGLSLEKALWLGLETFDGVFTILAATESEVGALRDNLAMKPLVYYQGDDGTVLFGTEQTCLTPVFPDVYATEMEPGGVKIWRV